MNIHEFTTTDRAVVAEYCSIPAAEISSINEGVLVQDTAPAGPDGVLERVGDPYPTVEVVAVEGTGRVYGRRYRFATIQEFLDHAHSRVEPVGVAS